MGKNWAIRKDVKIEKIGNYLGTILFLKLFGKGFV